MPTDRPPLFTPYFFLMCGFSFTVFFSVFFLLPTVPFHILALGGTKAEAGLFLGFLTYASAFSAPLTGAVADRAGKRVMLISCSLIIFGFSVLYAVSRDYRVPLALAFLHGWFWSGLLSASAAYVTDLVPESRRAEGFGYWGLASITAMAVGPMVGFWIYARGWFWCCAASGALNLLMAAIAWRLKEHRAPTGWGKGGFFTRGLLEWRVLLSSFTLFLYSFGYGSLTSFVAVYADANRVWPKGIYFTVLAVTMLATRPLSTPLGDRIGHKKLLMPSLALIVVGLSLLAVRGTLPWLVGSAVIFGLGYGTAYPMYVAHVMRFVDPSRRGAAFGAILAAFDTGVGSGSIVAGWLIEHFGFRAAFGTAAMLAALSAPYFLFTERRLRRPSAARDRPPVEAAS
jgi:MFS family permease